MYWARILVVPVALLIVAVSITYAAILISGGLDAVQTQLVLTRQTQERLAERVAYNELMEARAERVKDLAYDCARFTAQNEDPSFSPVYHIDSLTWLALTGGPDPDARIGIKSDEVEEAVIDRCYHAWFRATDLDDVRQYMREH